MAPHIRSHRAPCSCFPKKVSLQLSSEQSVGDVRITQLDWKRVPQARSPCKSSVAITTASRNVSWAQRAPSAVGHEMAVVCQVERRLPGQRLANLACPLSSRGFHSMAFGKLSNFSSVRVQFICCGQGALQRLFSQLNDADSRHSLVHDY